jgi:molybdopterin-guanine dinucleotide biosynthesis protein A
MRPERIAGVLLAGGLSRRMGGGDKCLRELAGQTILARIIERVAPQVGPLVLNANGDPGRFAETGLPVVPDVIEGNVGPLAGILTGMDWAAAHAPQCLMLASFPCDAPFLPLDMVECFVEAVKMEGADMACAASDGRNHPVFGLWPIRLREQLRSALEEEGIRKVDTWTDRYRLVSVEFPMLETAAGELDPFFNTNRPEDLEAALRFLN